MDFTQIQSAVYPYLFFLHRSDQRNNPILFNRCFKATRPLSKPSLFDNSNSFGICPDILLERNLDPRCAKFKEFLQANNITPELQRSALPSGFLTSAPPTQKPDRPTSEPLLPTSMSLVNDFMNYGKVYPFPSGNNLVTWVLSIFW